MYIDLIEKDDKSLIEQLKKLGFHTVFFVENGAIKASSDANAFALKLYSGKDYEFVIQKGKADVIMDLDKNGFLLNKGLCSKLKENGMFVVFKLKALVESQDFFRTYKNFTINSRLCNDYSVPALYVSFANNAEEIKSPIQLVAFAENFGYNYSNYKKGTDALLKKK